MDEYSLICSVCKTPYHGSGPLFICEQCGGQLEPLATLSSQAARDVIQSGCNSGLWDYASLLPVPKDIHPFSLGEGNTPLVKAKNLESFLGLSTLFLKNETLNPTGTYKDRFSSLALSLKHTRPSANDSKACHAVALGSAGNAAASVSAYAALAQIPCFVLLPPGAVAERGWQIQNYGAHLIHVEHTIDDCIQMVNQGKTLFGWTSLTTNISMNPLACEGYKTIAYEIGKQLSYSMPDWIVVPVGGAALLCKIYQGCQQMLSLGLIDRMPRFVGAQAAACAPLVDAFEKSLTVPQKWPGTPHTVAFAIADVCVYDGVTALDVLQKTNGCAIAASEEEILEATHLIASKEGILSEPSSACTLACVKKMLHAGLIQPSERVLCVLSGSGLRDLRLLSDTNPTVPYVHFHDFSALRRMVEPYLPG